MMSSRCAIARALVVTNNPPLGWRANAVTSRLIWSASRKSIGVSSRPKDGAAAWIAPICPAPPVVVESRSTAAEARRDFLEQFQRFRAQAEVALREPGHIAAGVSE